MSTPNPIQKAEAEASTLWAKVKKYWPYVYPLLCIAGGAFLGHWAAKL